MEASQLKPLADAIVMHLFGIPVRHCSVESLIDSEVMMEDEFGKGGHSIYRERMSRAVNPGPLDEIGRWTGSSVSLWCGKCCTQFDSY